MGTATKISITPLTAAIGAQVDGVDLREPLGDEVVTELVDALSKHLVLFFRDQELSDEQHLAVARQFGTPRMPSHASKDPAKATPLVFVEDTSDSPPKADHWHTDVPYSPTPPDMAILCARDIPPVGGDTLWVSLPAVFNSLSEPMRQFLSDLTMSYAPGMPLRDAVVKNYGEEYFAELLRKEPTPHPMLRLHPLTGERTLFFSGAEFGRDIVGLLPDESQAIQSVLRSRLDNPNYQVRWRWRTHDVAMWDEWSTNHRATGDHWPSYRAMRRCLVDGVATRPRSGSTA